MEIKFLVTITLVITFIFLFALGTIIVSSDYQTQNKTFQGIVYGNPWVVPLKFSVLPQNNFVKIFDAYIYNSSYGPEFLLNYFAYSPSNSTLISDVGVFTSSLAYSSKIEDFNYFITSDIGLLAVSVENNSGYFLSIAVLHRNQINKTYSINSSSKFNLDYITSFTGSNDVYLSFNNDQTFTILKYNYESNSFSKYFSVQIPGPGSDKISDVNAFKLDEKIFALVTVKNINDETNSNCSIYIVNQQQILFNKTFLRLDINTFTPYSSGLILYSKNNGTFYDYQFSSSKIVAFDTNLSYNYNVSTFKPFDNQSFLVLGSNYIKLVNITDISGNAILHDQDTYIISNSNNFNDQSVIQTLILQSQKYFIYGTINNNLFDFDIFNIAYPPNGIQPRSSNIENSITTNATNNTIGPILNVSPIFILSITVIVGCIIVLIIYIKDKHKRNNDSSTPTRTLDYEKRKNDFVEKSQNKGQNKDLNTIIIPNYSCQLCGTVNSPEDIFCQECGSRLKK